MVGMLACCSILAFSIFDFDIFLRKKWILAHLSLQPLEAGLMLRGGVEAASAETYLFACF